MLIFHMQGGLPVPILQKKHSNMNSPICTAQENSTLQFCLQY